MRDTGPIIWSASWPDHDVGHRPAAVEALLGQLQNWSFSEGPGWIVGANRPDCIVELGGWLVASPTGQFVNRARGLLLSRADLCGTLDRNGQDWVQDLAPPFRFLTVDRRKNHLTVHFDQFGLGHWFEGDSNGVRFTASSPRLIAQAIAAEPDLGALLGYSQLGVFAFSATPYMGVRKLLPSDPWATQYSHKSAAVPVQDLHHQVETSFRDAVQSLLAAAPTAALELSGGLDSRLILAAMTPEQRAGRRALTLGSPAEISPDQRIASKLASDFRLVHQINQPPANPWQDPAVLFATLADACSGYQAMGNPVDKATLLANGEDDPELVRFGGQNGEILRGFYHAMQPLGSVASPGRWANLFDWRLTANDKVSPRFLSQHARSAIIPAQRSALLAELDNFGGEWGQVLDRLYLRLRMQAWVGNAASSNLVKRTMLMPFFDPQFVSAAMALPAASRSQSMAAYRLLHGIDPVLSGIPLDSGRTPTSFLNPGLGTKLQSLRKDVGKLVRKISQRIRPSSGAALGSAGVVEAWHQHRGAERLDFGHLDRLGIFDPAMLDALQAGTIVPDRSELGFLLICDNL